MTLGAGSAAPNTSGEASDGEKSDGEAGDALPSSATDVDGAVATGGMAIVRGEAGPGLVRTVRWVHPGLESGSKSLKTGQNRFEIA